MWSTYFVSPSISFFFRVKPLIASLLLVVSFVFSAAFFRKSVLVLMCICQSLTSARPSSHFLHTNWAEKTCGAQEEKKSRTRAHSCPQQTDWRGVRCRTSGWHHGVEKGTGLQIQNGQLGDGFCVGESDVLEQKDTAGVLT